MSKCQCDSTSAVACNLLAFNPEERSRYNQLRRELTADLSIEEIPSGFAFLYPNQSSLLLKIAEWIFYENQCCPFIKFSLYVSGEADIIRLELTGNEVVKNLLREEFSLF
ncbi:hypothetical protein ACQCT5_02895 [Sutcliffiella halmapala]